LLCSSFIFTQAASDIDFFMLLTLLSLKYFSYKDTGLRLTCLSDIQNLSNKY